MLDDEVKAEPIELDESGLDALDRYRLRYQPEPV
jgi:hypothetical protein